MTLQEMFNTAARGIITQGGKSADEHGQCRYRGADGRRCAAGHLISDTLAQKYEGSGVRAIRMDYPNLFSGSGWTLMHRMQGAHDVSSSEDFEPRARWSERMRRIALDFGLSTSVLDTWEGETARG